MLPGQPGVVRVQSLHLGPQRLVLLLRPGGPGERLVPGRGETVDLCLGRGGPAAGGVRLAVEPGQPLAPVGEGACGVLQAALLLGQPAFELGAVVDGVLQGAARRLQRRRQLGLLLADAGGLAFHVLRIAPAALLGNLGTGRCDARIGEADGAADALGELRELIPGRLGALEARGKRPHLLLQLRLPAHGLLQTPLGRLFALLQGGLVGDLRAERGTLGDQVVGEQPQPRVAQIGLDHGGPPGDRRLPSEWFELAPQLVGEILDTGQIGLHGVQFAQRLLLALAMFQNAGRLLDERAAAGGIGVQHRIQLALSDDDVHLTADTGVGEQILHVEQPAGVAVDLVFAAAVAEHRPRNGDLGVVDGKCTVGIVDGQGHLCPAQRRAAGRPGENDVLHLAAAQRLGPLLTHDPRKSVHHIGFTRPVRADHAGDAGLEAQRRGGGEGLEPAQGQALEVHAVRLYPTLLGNSPFRRGGCRAHQSVSHAGVVGTPAHDEGTPKRPSH